MVEVWKSGFLWIIPLLIIVFLFGLPAYAQYGGGSGTANNPYLIYTAEQMNAIGVHPDDWDKYFKLMAEIDLSAYTGTYFNIIWNFNGVFDGNNHTISNFTYTCTGKDDIGLFGSVGWGAEIIDLGLINPNVDAGTGGLGVGSLAGSLDDGVISNCYVEGGSVVGDQWVGGLLGIQHGTIGNCYSSASVSGNFYVGGLVGQNGGTISSCYSTGNVSGNDREIGGLVGGNLETITNCYSTGEVSGDWGVGGLVGENSDTIINCYATGSVWGTGLNWIPSGIGGLVGDNSSSFFGSGGTISNSFWDTETSGQSNMCGSQDDTATGCDNSYGRITTEMQTASTFLEAGWDFVDEAANGTDDIWWILDGQDYPQLLWEEEPGEESEIQPDEEPEIQPGEEPEKQPEEKPEIQQLSDFLTGAGTENDPYLIFTAEEMNLIGLCEKDWDKHFRLMTDIDLSGYKGTDYNIIGYWAGLDSPDNRPFSGVFDGNRHTISNFTYTCTGIDDIGLFGYIDGSHAEIKDLGLIDPNIDAGMEGWEIGSLSGYLREGTIRRCYVKGGIISGNEDVGGLVGFNFEGTITYCYSNVSVSGNEEVGGLVGTNAGTITNCYSTGSVSGIECVGGLVGFYFGIIDACYSTGHVAGTVDVGGLTGWGGGAIASFWDIETSGQSTGPGGKGKTTTQMQTASTFVGWSFGAVWTIDEGNDYPRLWWEKEPGEAPETQQLSDFLTGAGTEGDPYLIYTAEELNTIGLFQNEWDKHFKLMADIDLAGITGTDFNFIGIGTDNAFTGVFDGNGRTISNFTYTNPSVANVGLFAYVNSAAVIIDLGLINPNVDTGTWGWGVGSLVGWLEDGAIINCYVEGGSVSGDEDTGGLVGSNQGTITDCYAICIVSCNINGGGLVGNNWAGTITNCYSAGSVTGNKWVGGLMGNNLVGEITNCYSAGSVFGNEFVAGLVGNNEFGTITNCYATGHVSGNELVGGLVGENTSFFSFGAVSNSFWDIETSGQTASAGGTGKTTTEMQTRNTFTNAGWDFVDETANGTQDIWWIDEGQGYPRLSWEPSFN